MKAELSQPTLGLLRRILEEMQPEDILVPEETVRFWKDTLFDFAFAPAIIEVAAGYGFTWGEIISDLFVGRFGRQNSYFSNAVSPYTCEQTLKRLVALGLFHSRDTSLGDDFRQSLGDDGFDLKTAPNDDLSVPAEVQQKLKSPLDAVELEITRLVLDRFLNLHESTPRKPLIIKFKTLDVLDKLVQCSIIKTYDQGEHYLPLSLSFHYSGNAATLDRARKSVEITLNVLRNLYEVEPDKPDSHFTFAEIEAHARKMYDNFEPELLKLGLYLLQEFSGVFKGYASNTQGTEMTFVSINDRIVTLDIKAAWDEHVNQHKQYIEREHLRKPVARRQVMRAEATKGNETMPSTKPGILVLISHSSKDKALAEALIELLRSALGLLPNQIRCTSVDGYRLPAGVNTDAQLRTEIKSVGVLIGLLTPNSIASTYVLFELGARWGAELFMIPLLAGITPERMQGPQRVLNAVSCETEAQLIQLVEDIGRQLNLEVQSAASYLKHARAVKSLADNIPAISDQAAREEMKPSGPHNYFYQNDSGPYCPACWQRDEKRVLLPASADFAGRIGRRCHVCKELYIEQPQKESAASKPHKPASEWS